MEFAKGLLEGDAKNLSRCEGTMPKFCTHCGSQITGGSKFCGVCGKAVPVQQAPAPPSVTQPSALVPRQGIKLWVIGTIAGVVVVVVVIAIVAALFLGGGLGGEPLKDCGMCNSALATDSECVKVSECMAESIETCSRAKSTSMVTSTSGTKMTFYSEIRGQEGDKCVIYYKLSSAASGYSDATCKVPMSVIGISTGFGKSTVIDQRYCSGSL